MDWIIEAAKSLEKDFANRNANVVNELAEILENHAPNRLTNAASRNKCLVFYKEYLTKTSVYYDDSFSISCADCVRSCMDNWRILLEWFNNLDK